MRVLHISAGNLYGGVETLLSTLARQRDLCPEMTPRFAVCFESRLSSELRQAGVPVYWLGEVRARWPWTVWRARRKLMDLLNSQASDVVVCHSVWAQAVFGPVARSAGLPLVCWLHAGPKGTHWLERWAKRTRPDEVICNSRFTAEHLANLYPGIPAKVIHCPVTIPDKVSHRAERQATRAELKVPEEAVIIIQVSRIEPLKGHRLHLEALAKLLDLPGWECWFVGGAQQASEQRYLEEIKRTAVRLGIRERVRFLGQRSDVSRLMAAADIYCQPNTSPDSFGITYIEGLLAGLPVVTTAMGGALEIVDSSCGALVHPDDPAALAACLRQLILDPGLRSRLGKAAPSRARSLCDPGQQMARICEFFQRMSRPVMAA
jgi:glycosyltransferase involved in cell wall biosynthesis